MRSDLLALAESGLLDDLEKAVARRKAARPGKEAAQAFNDIAMAMCANASIGGPTVGEIVVANLRALAARENENG